jgi:hypothetical protein
MAEQKDLTRSIFGGFIQRQPCTVADMEDVNLGFRYREEDPVFVVPAALKFLTDFPG